MRLNFTVYISHPHMNGIPVFITVTFHESNGRVILVLKLLMFFFKHKIELKLHIQYIFHKDRIKFGLA